MEVEVETEMEMWREGEREACFARLLSDCSNWHKRRQQSPAAGSHYIAARGLPFVGADVGARAAVATATAAPRWPGSARSRVAGLQGLAAAGDVGD